MGEGEDNTPVKHSNLSSLSQDVPTTPPYADWSSAMQAYYGAGATPPPFFAPTVASTPHPYMWGGQHPLISPYGTPVPYPPIYPVGGFYSHPNMVMTPSSTQANMDLEGNETNGRDQASAKISNGRSGNTGLAGGGTAETEKAVSGSGNDDTTQSAESGSEGSLDGSDENNKESASSKKRSFDQMLVDGAHAQNNTAGAIIPALVPGKPVVSMPATNLNIGMDLWNPSTGAGKLRSNPSGVTSAVTPATMIGQDQWNQDERELKRQKRKQSNRESARRSRLRKQAECEELQGRVDALSNENQTIKEELQRLSNECQKLTSENSSIKEELTQLC